MNKNVKKDLYKRDTVTKIEKMSLNSCGMYFDTECTFWHEMHLKPRGIFSV
ncbi:17667_t:CDS:2 [Entrophospora sp. SA101]|nr:17667_t:CDS:2 [Entrophospora sp. SA101]